MYRQHNEQLEDHLSEKVSILKQLTLDIHDEAKKGNKQLDEMQEDMASVGVFMKSTMKRLDNLIASGGGGSMCKVGVFVFFMFLMIYFWLT